MTNPFEELREEFKVGIDRVQDAVTRIEKIRTPHGLENYISADRAAELLGVEKKTLIDHKTKIGFVKQFKQIWFLKDDLQAYMEQGRPQRKMVMRTRQAIRATA